MNTSFGLTELYLSQDLKNGEVVYSNLVSILTLGVKSVLEQRESQLYGPVLEEAVSLSFQILIHAFLKESLFEEAGCPSHQVRGFITLSSGCYVWHPKSLLYVRRNFKKKNDC